MNTRNILTGKSPEVCAFLHHLGLPLTGLRKATVVLESEIVTVNAEFILRDGDLGNMIEVVKKYKLEELSDET